LRPNITASLASSNNQLNSTAPNALGKSVSTNTGYPSSNSTVTLRQPLFRTYLTAQYRQAQAQTEDAEAVLAQDEQDLAVRVCGAYFEALLNQEQLALVLAQRAAYQTQLAAAHKLLELGAGTRTDVDEAQARLDMTVANEIEARQNGDFTMRQLQTLVNQPVDGLARLDLGKFTLTAPQPDQVQSWIETAELKSHRLRSLRAQMEVSRTEVEKAQAGHMPTLDATAQWSKSVSESTSNLQSAYTNNTVGLQLSIPIYAGGQVSSSVRQAQALLERSAQLLEAARRELAVNVHKEFRGVTESMARARALEQALRSADQVLRSNQKSLAGGSRTMVDVMNAEQQRVQVLRDLAQTRYVHLISRIRLLAQVSDANAQEIAAINQLLGE
jgi:protease secretion system outer membrane protein